LVMLLSCNTLLRKLVSEVGLAKIFQLSTVVFDIFDVEL